MRRREQRVDRSGVDPDYVIDWILRAVRRPNPVGDREIFVVAWRQYRRTALESIAPPLEDVDYIDFDGRIVRQVQYCLWRCDIGEEENTVHHRQGRLRREIGR